MKSRKLKLEFYDNDGIKHSVTVDGPVNREKIGKLLDLVEVMTGRPELEPAALSSSPHKYDRLASLVVMRFRSGSFKASEARTKYEEVFNERISLSTVSTYLSRLSEKGVVERTQHGSSVEYAVTLKEERRLLGPSTLRPAPPASNPEHPA